MNIEIEVPETYTVKQIRDAFRLHSHPDDWGVACFYEDGLIAALRGEYDEKPANHPAECGVEWVGCHAANLSYICTEPEGHEGCHRGRPDAQAVWR